MAATALEKPVANDDVAATVEPDKTPVPVESENPTPAEAREVPGGSGELLAPELLEGSSDESGASDDDADGFPADLIEDFSAVNGSAPGGFSQQSSASPSAIHNWPGNWTNPTVVSRYNDWGFNICGGEYLAGLAHLGADSQGAPSGSVVKAIGSGTVKAIVGYSTGQAAIIQHKSTAGDFVAVYGHINPTIGVGATVSAGTQLGTVTYWAPSNSHLHFSVIPGAYRSGMHVWGARNCAAGETGNFGYVNPLPWLAANGPASSNHDPRGNLDSAVGGIGTITFGGWAFDHDAPSTSLGIHLYIGGPAGSAGAEFHTGITSVHRPDVAAAFPGAGTNQGFDISVVTGKRGRQKVYVYAINLPAGNNPLIGTADVTVGDPNPFGNLDSVVSPGVGKIKVAGWTFDPNAPKSPVVLHAYVGGPSGTGEFHDLGATNVLREDIPLKYPQTSPNQGFDVTFDTNKRGRQVVHVYALNVSGTPGDNVLIGSSTVTIDEVKNFPSVPIPTINGTAQVGETLTVLPGDWINGTSLTYQWLRDGSVISGATKTSYTLTNADVGKRISVTVTGSKAGYTTTSKTSAPTAKVQAKAITKAGWVLEDGKWYYYVNGVKHTGWLASGGIWYYMNSSGVMQTGWVADGGTWYFMSSSGAMKTGWVSTGGSWYYLKPSGAMHTGWLHLSGSWYYLKPSGAMVTGTYVIDGATHRFNSSGVWLG
ncbi:MAG: hypothetical protein QM705_14370 [Ancrocorticia sp.]